MIIFQNIPLELILERIISDNMFTIVSDNIIIKPSNRQNQLYKTNFEVEKYWVICRNAIGITS